jgi:uncharacterized phiE125 gp8 family phage protein
MTQRQILPPAVLPVDLSVAKANMRIDGDDMDALVKMWITGITAKLEHEIGQCMMAQTWEVSLDHFPGRPHWSVSRPLTSHFDPAIALPHPAMTVSSVTYLDSDGVEQTLDPSAYRLKKTGYQSMLLPARGECWPDAAREDGAITVTVVCGYGADATSTPPAVQLYIMAKLVEQFDPATMTQRDQTSDTVHSKFTEGLLDRCRSYQ